MHYEDDGDRGCRLFRGLYVYGALRQDQVHLEPNQVGREFWEPSEVALGFPELDQEVPALDPAALPQAKPEGLPQPSFYRVRGFVRQDTHARYTFPACCASVASGAVRRPPARVPTNTRRVIIG
jgi:hypothetical protein